MIFMPQTFFNKVEGHIALGLSVGHSVCLSVTKIVTVLKFHK